MDAAVVQKEVVFPKKEVSLTKTWHLTTSETSRLDPETVTCSIFLIGGELQVEQE
jgi:hypothetical protein